MKSKKITTKQIKERIASEVEALLDTKTEATAMERMTDKIFAAGLTKAITLINELEAESENNEV